MTEQEWLACTEPFQMFNFLRGADSPARRGLLGWLGLRQAGPTAPPPYRASNRKLRLLACACCRRIEELLTDERSREAVEVSERFGDGLADAQELAAARAAAENAARALIEGQGVAWDAMSAGAFGQPAVGWRAFAWAARAAAEAASLEAPELAVPLTTTAALEWGAHANPERVAERMGAKALLGLMREFFGPLPFRPLVIPPGWLTWRGGLVESMARRKYDSRDFTDMPILADALEDSGCSDADILRHCRESGEHVRGCWVVDLLLGKI